MNYLYIIITMLATYGLCQIVHDIYYWIGYYTEKRKKKNAI
jgi:hypothetical protein